MLNPANRYAVIANIVNIMYTLMKFIDVCLMLGVICSVFPSEKYSLLRLTDDGTITNSRNIIPSPPNHWSKLLHIEIEYGSMSISYIVNPVDVIPDIPSKYASMNDKSPEIRKGNAEKNAVNNHITITKNIDPFNDKFVILLCSDFKNSIIPMIMQIIADIMNDSKYLGESLYIMAVIIGITINMPSINITTAI